jgi:hypothetical protein|tara:strand:- start:894 stop:1526 length:633 start_codon:yes stop_codon:yes gene_type:complete
MVNISRKDLERLAIGFGVADFLTEGRLSAPIARGTKAALKKAAPAIGRALIRYGPTVALTAARVTPTPLAAAATGAVLVQNREAVANLTRQGFEVLAPPVQAYGQGVIERVMDPEQLLPLETGQGPALEKFFGLPSGKPRRKIASKFNKAVKAGMAAVKGSTSYGKKGTINNARKAFSAVTKVASKVKQGKKVAVKGIQGKIARAVRKIL